MNQTNKLILLIILTAIVAVVGTYFVLEKNQGKMTTNESYSTQDQHKPFTYGTFDSYFTGQDSITYPLIFNNIRIIGDQKSPAVNFGPQNFEGFEIFMNVTKMARKDASNFKSMLLERGLVSEGTKSTRNGYVGEILSSDLNARPDSNTQTCSFGYRYFVPLANSNNDLELEVQASQPEWGQNGDYSHCKIFDDQNYSYLKAMMDYVIANIQPAF